MPGAGVVPSSRRRLAAVTGASSGIGEVFARRLAGLGYDVLLVARRRERLEELARSIESGGRVRAEVLVADLAEEAGLARAAAAIASRQDLEILVNNAGFGTRGPFFEASAETAERMHRLHVLATVRLTHAALAGMVKRGRGSVVNISSVAAFGQTPGNAAYGATKAWMNSFTEGLDLELRSIGSPVRVQSLCPGYTVTEFHAVMGVGREHVPDSWWMTAEEVVDASLRGLRRGKLHVVPGWRYRLIVLLLKTLPHGLVRAATLRFGEMRRGRQ